MRLIKWLKSSGYDYLELQGSPVRESQTTTWVRNAACHHFKKNVVNKVFQKLLRCAFFASLCVLVYILFSGWNWEDVHWLYSLAVIGLVVGILVFWLISYAIINALYSTQMTAISLVCGIEEIPEWVVHLPEIGFTPEKSRWIMIEVCSRSYVLSMDTLSKIGNEDFFEFYLISM